MTPPIPPIDRRLVDYLDATFPDRCPDPKDTDREIWMKVGATRLVTWLRHHYDQQQDADADVPSFNEASAYFGERSPTA